MWYNIGTKKYGLFYHTFPMALTIRENMAKIVTMIVTMIVTIVVENSD